MSRRISNLNKTECYVCKKNGESWRVYEDHNFRDTKGRISCKNFLRKMRENCCYKCDGYGHFADHCKGTKPFVFKKFYSDKPTAKENKIVAMVITKNVFSEIDVSYDEDAPHPIVAVRKPVSKVATMDWTAESDSEDDF